VWDIGLSDDGRLVATGTLDGSCLMMTAEGRRLRQYKTKDWVHSISLSADGALLALGRGMNGVELIDGIASKCLWSVEDASPVHNVVLTGNRCVLSAGDVEALLRDESGRVIWRYAAERRLLGGDIEAGHRFAILRCVDKRLIRVNLRHCRDRAALNYERAGNLAEAASLYEGMKDHDRAAELFSKTGDYINAARNVETLQRPLEAAELYEKGEGFDYQAHGESKKAARCFHRAGKTARAAELLEQAGEPEEAARLYEQAGNYGKAGALYKSIGDVPSAIRMLTEHLTEHSEDMEMHLELGLLLAENAQYDTAIEQLQKTAQDERFRKIALMRVAECFVAKNLYDIAINRYQACLQEGEQVSWQNLDVFYGMGKAHQLAGNYRQARQIYERILAIDYQYEDVRERLDEVETLSSAFAATSTTSSRHEAATVVNESDMTVTLVDTPYQQLPSQTKERYVVKGQLGKGGMGAVYLAEDKRLRRTVALKILPPELAQDDKLRLRLIREAQAVAQINHPNVVAVFDVGDEMGNSYISMEYVEGQTVRDILKDKGKLEVRQCVDLLLGVTQGLGYAHRKGITHRDIKPENIMVAQDGTAKIMDFGLALVEGATRLTVPGAVAGTWRYMAPEQVRGEEELSPAADVYAVGCMSYELLTGKPPFTGGDVGIQHLSQDPKPLSEVEPGIPGPVEGIVIKCLQKDPADRYADAEDLNQALRKAADQL